MILGIMGNSAKPRFVPIVSSFILLLKERGIKFVYDEENRESIYVDPAELIEHEKVAEVADLVLSFGGDGTLLHTAAAVAPHHKPILGINLGPGLGYLTDLDSLHLHRRLDDILNQNYEIEERMMIQATVEGESAVYHALNDFVIGQHQVSRTQSFEVFIDGTPASTYRADGLIVASPTGSTAYSLSAGGPIIEPTLHSIIVTPVCPHTLTMRPLALAENRTVAIRSMGDGILTADGEQVKALNVGQQVVVKKSPMTTKLVNIMRRDFYEVLRDKLNWGAAPENA
ncbi:MAG: NAD(+)/NADH kinase [Calditrichaeota bacterium]|nr:NAD(+)/NADH kinase [Calditrichota bacterium]MCB9368707.1 NAD(+)/NADH kinase [Calditrichota bacterium]